MHAGSADGAPIERSFSSTTAVEFDDVSAAEVQAYIATGACGHQSALHASSVRRVSVSGRRQ